MLAAFYAYLATIIGKALALALFMNGLTALVGRYWRPIEIPKKLVFWASVGIVFVAGFQAWREEHEKVESLQAVHPAELTPERPVLDPIQEKLLRVLVGYERQFGSSKIIVGYDGSVVPPSWDVKPTPTGINLAQDLYGDPSRTDDLRSLVETMPSEYIRLIPELRFDSFTIVVTSEGVTYAHTRETGGKP